MNALLVSKQKRRDWFQIIRRDLAYAGVSQDKVASACGRDPKTVENWVNGGDPKDTDARIVLALYSKFCPIEYERHMKEFQPDYRAPTKPRPQRTQHLDQHDLFEAVKP